MVALITGASRGIGETISLELGNLGFDLALVGRDKESLKAVAEKHQTLALGKEWTGGDVFDDYVL